MPISVRAVPCLSAEVRCAPQAAHLAPACADADGLEIPSSACNRAFRGFAWRYSDRYHEDLSSCVLYSQLRQVRGAREVRATISWRSPLSEMPTPPRTVRGGWAPLA